MTKSIYIIAGEESGDVLGARLMAALQSIGQFDFHGIGGQGMQAQGLNSLFPMQDLSVMGLFEILPRLPQLVRHVHETVDDIAQRQPDVVITIDSPDFCKPVIRRARKKCPNTKFIHYVAPTVWAWREGRAKTMAKLFDGLICLFPFEPAYFEEYGLKTAYCGHPVVETISPAESHRTNDHILIFPGSRTREVKIMAPIFAEVYRKMRNMNPDLQARIVALPHVRETVENAFAVAMNSPQRRGSVSDNLKTPAFAEDTDHIIYINPHDRYDAMKRAPFALAKSGTTGLELATAECPHVIAYKMNALTWWVLRRLIKVDYAHIVNIMERKEIIPECLQEECNADDIMQSVLGYRYPDLHVIREKLSGDDPSQPPSMQAAEFVCQFL